MSTANQSSTTNLILSNTRIIRILSIVNFLKAFTRNLFFSNTMYNTLYYKIPHFKLLRKYHKSKSRFNFSNPFLVFCYCLILVSSFCAAPKLLAQGSEESLTEKNAQKSIGISQIVEHPALDEVRSGLISALKEEGFVEGKNLKIQYENAQGNISTSSQIASKLLSAKLDLAVAISTPSAQTLFFAAQKQNHHIPIVFSAVSDPEAAKLISTSYPITGVTDAPNLDGLLEVIQKMLPNLKTLGLMYNPAEANSVSTIQKLKKLLKSHGIAAHEVTVNKTSDVAQAMHSLIGKVDALYFPQDNTVVAAIETVVSVAQHSSPTLPVILPIFSSDPALIKRGILAAVGFDYVEVGKETGKVVAKILQGTEANKIPIHNPEVLRAVINKDLAEKLGLSVPTELKYSKLQFIE